MLGLSSAFTKINVAHYEDISADVLVCAEIFFKDVLNLVSTRVNQRAPKNTKNDQIVLLV